MLEPFLILKYPLNMIGWEFEDGFPNEVYMPPFPH